MDEQKLERLRALAEKATKSPWTHREGVHHHFIEAPDNSDVAQILTSRLGIHEQRLADAQYLAACDPQTIIELIEAVRATMLVDREKLARFFFDKTYGYAKSDFKTSAFGEPIHAEATKDSYEFADALIASDLLSGGLSNG